MDNAGRLCSKFPKLPDAKLEDGVFVVSNIRKLLSDSFLFNLINPTEKTVWESFGHVVHHLLANKKEENYKKIVERIICENILSKRKQNLGQSKFHQCQ